jgi:hypothetical protein
MMCSFKKKTQGGSWLLGEITCSTLGIIMENLRLTSQCGPPLHCFSMLFQLTSHLVICVHHCFTIHNVTITTSYFLI